MRRLLGRLALATWPAWRRLLPAPSRERGLPRHPDRPDRRPRILIVSPLPIHPPIHGAAVRISSLIRRMAAWAEVSLLVLGEATDDPGHRRAFGGVCERVLFHRVPAGPDPQADPWGLLPPAAARFADPGLTERVEALVDAHLIDTVQLEFAELGSLVRRRDAARTVLVEHDLGFATQARQRALAIDRRFAAGVRLGSRPLDGRRQERFETLACAAADQVHCMSGHDRARLAARLADPGHLRVVANGVDTATYRPGPAAGRHGVLFLGSFPHLPNLDAFEHLLAEVWPAIRRRRPDATLTVAGARPPAGVLAADGRDGVTVVGEVEEVGSLYRAHRALVVPLRAGSGTRLKILEALACGLPVVSTTIGVEGLELSDPPEIAIADRPAAIADAVVSLLAAPDDELEAVGRRGRALVEARYDWDAIGEGLRSAHAELVETGPRRPRLATLAIDPPGEGDAPEVSVVVPTSATAGIGRGLLDGLAAQQLDRAREVIAVDRGSPAEALEAWRAEGLRVVSVDGPAGRTGAALNAGAAAARGRVLVFVAPDAIPADPAWLARLVAPFDDERAPAAVQGGITTQVEDGGLPVDPGFTQETRRWRAGHDGVVFDLANAALARAVWEAFPLPADGRLADLVWQRQATDQGLLILPCLAAAVRRVVPTCDPEAIFEASREEGAAWRRLGVHYRLADLRADLAGTGPGLDAAGLPTPVDHPVHRALVDERPRGLFIGANPRTWRLAPRRYTRRYTEGR